MKSPGSTELHRAVVDRLRETGFGDVEIASSRPVGGGSIHRAERLETTDGRSLFLKWSAGADREVFEVEADGLRAIEEVGVIRVPTGATVGESGPGAFLVMEAIDEGSPARGLQRRFGALFAEHHRASVGDRYGWHRDNLIGASPQPNGWLDDWVTFFRERRLGFQLDLARRNGRSDDELDRLGRRLLDRLDELLDLPDEPACLLHGDLWGGNYLVDSGGDPVLVDPAVYRGQREADLAMTRLFGGFERDFYDGYDEAWPLPSGTRERQEIYGLYHLLNHLNLFGGGYRSGCLRVLRRYAA